LIQGETVSDKQLKYSIKGGKNVYVIARMMLKEAADGKSKEFVVLNTNITGLRMRLRKVEKIALENKERYKAVSDECTMLKRNIAAFMRKKGEEE
jgi:ABC-type antimicrobial peptide transport system ATPase subunit